MPQAFRRELLLALPLLLAAGSRGQSASSPNPVTLNPSVAVPVSTGVLGRRDASALTEILEHLKVVGASPWAGMQGTGKITFGSQDATAYDATLSTLGADRFRLDAQMDKGEMSIRIHGKAGKIKGSDGRTLPIPPATAMAGIFPFQLPRLARITGPDTSLIDRGLAVVGGKELHRITFEMPSLGRNPVTKSPETIATDLYFDPASHLLIMSVNSGTIADSRPVKFLFAVTYGDYRKSGSSLVPFRYTETMEGEQYWTLQLSNVQLNPALDATYFEF